MDQLSSSIFALVLCIIGVALMIVALLQRIIRRRQRIKSDQ